MKFEPPASLKKSFTCPHCHVLARHYHWGYSGEQNAGPLREQHPQIGQTVVRVSQCEHCDGLLIWYQDQLVHPDQTSAPPPNPDMPPDVLKDYREAASILAKSPRGAAALLRLAVQKLCVALDEDGKHVNTDIANLVKRGLPQMVQQAMDVVRVTGNNAVHPGQIDTDDEEVAASLFPLLNIVVEHMVSRPKRVESLYQGLPEGARDGIAKRDSAHPK